MVVKGLSDLGLARPTKSDDLPAPGSLQRRRPPASLSSDPSRHLAGRLREPRCLARQCREAKRFHARLAPACDREASVSESGLRPVAFASSNIVPTGTRISTVSPAPCFLCCRAVTASTRRSCFTRRSVEIARRRRRRRRVSSASPSPPSGPPAGTNFSRRAQPAVPPRPARRGSAPGRGTRLHFRSRIASHSAAAATGTNRFSPDVGTRLPSRSAKIVARRGGARPGRNFVPRRTMIIGVTGEDLTPSRFDRSRGPAREPSPFLCAIRLTLPCAGIRAAIAFSACLLVFKRAQRPARQAPTRRPRP
jgi:hypothetical protein